MKLKLSIKGEVNKDLTLERLKKVLFKSILKMHELAVINVPVDKGLLKRSINFFPQSFGAINYLLIAGMEYAEPVEFGTIKMSAQPYMRPSLDQVRNIWVKRFFLEELGKQKV